MNENSIVKGNYEIAKEEADRVDNEIIGVLREGKSFRVEAGAGSGKTYSLIKTIEWIQSNKQKEYKKSKKQVICITYTNAAVDVIKERLEPDSFIIPSTIHSFAWNAIKQFQHVLLDIIEKDDNFKNEEGDFEKAETVNYTLGHRYKKLGVQYLHHNDVLNLFVKLLENKKFRRIFSDKYPLLLIDEYQDTYKPIIDEFIKHFIAENIGPQFGFFGDAWQTIYQSNNACGLVEHENIIPIKKGSNFRSAPKIVDLLNKLRTDLPQVSAIDNFEGETTVITCEDYVGKRRIDKMFKNDLPEQELRKRLDDLRVYVKTACPSEEKTKALMITHKVLASQQGYSQLLEILNSGLRDREDVFLLFFMNTVEPIYDALLRSDMELLFETLKINRVPITKKSEKARWKSFAQELKTVREQKSIDVLKTVIDSKLIDIPPAVEGYYDLYSSAPETLYRDVTIKDFLDIDYQQFISAIYYFHPESEFSTEHGVKGEEYDNVIFVISKGWYQYQFDVYAPMISDTAPIPKGKEAAFERNRNLFYVCCSRPKKRLFIFVTIPVNGAFESFLTDLVGEENILTYSEFVNINKNEQ